MLEDEEMKTEIPWFIIFMIFSIFILIIMGNYVSNRFLNPVPISEFIEQKNIDCKICLESQYSHCYTMDKYCWILIDNIHQICYQNCTVELES
jgi:hypothetical protein